MKRAIVLIFLLVFSSCGNSNSGVDQQGGDEVGTESATTDFGDCNSPQSFDECPGPLPMELMDVEQDLLEGVGPESVPYLQRTYLMNCVSRSDSSIDRSEVAMTCECLYQGLVDYLRAQGPETQAVRWFVELEESVVEGGVPDAWAMEVYLACA